MSSHIHLGEQIAEIPLLDHHCHAPLRLSQKIDPGPLRTAFTESADHHVQWNDTPETIAYRTMIRWLARLLDVEPTESAVLQTRNSVQTTEYHRMLASDARLGPLYADYLFAESTSYSPAEWAELSGCPVRPVLRIETLAERLLRSTNGLDEFLDAFRGELSAAPGEGVVSFKSIAAYRCGLELPSPDLADVRRAFDRLRVDVETGVFGRLTDPTLISALVWETLTIAVETGLPLQFHVGLGDDDVYLPSANPVLLRPLFQEARFQAVPIVLLHCYPYVREAAYLSSIYPNAYTDLGLTIPFAGHHTLALLDEALGVAPANKILASTDGHGVPEFQWFTAHLWRRGLERVLAQIVDDDFLALSEAIEIAHLVLHGNSERIYPQ